MTSPEIAAAAGRQEREPLPAVPVDRLASTAGAGCGAVRHPTCRTGATPAWQPARSDGAAPARDLVVGPARGRQAGHRIDAIQRA
jgi:hypothetical protein